METVSAGGARVPAGCPCTGTDPGVDGTGAAGSAAAPGWDADSTSGAVEGVGMGAAAGLDTAAVAGGAPSGDRRDLSTKAPDPAGVSP